ncbi:MAG: radical SAM protein [Candidatus Thorarchaeota archaeon]
MLCPNHETEKRIISQSIGICSECIRNGLQSIAQKTHETLRVRDRLVPSVPTHGSTTCDDCGNHCRLNEGDIGFCNIRIVKDGRVIDRYTDQAVVSWYFDPLPTNCVADWVCPVTSERDLGFGHKRLKNLAVFYGSCNSDCLFCQNASYRTMMAKGKPLLTPQELANAADDYTACVCYFGGDPACNPSHSLETSRLLNEEKHVRVCYETNGNISKKWLDSIASVVANTGGTFKFDIKAVTPEVYRTLTGVSNSVMLRNFKELSAMKRDREGEFLVASVLLVPGYVDIPEVKRICSFIAENDTTIPTALLGFSPHHAMSDLPRTSRAHAQAALDTANDEGLTNVRVGNLGLLGRDDYFFY